jgi:MFS family permease
VPDPFPPKRLRRRLDPRHRPGGGAAAGPVRTSTSSPAAAGGAGPEPTPPLGLLRDRTFGPFFVGNLVSNAGNWFQNLAAGVVVYALTESNTLVGLVSVLQFTATLLLSPWAGVAGDRYDRKRLLVGAQALSALGAGALALAVALLGVDGLGGPLPVFAATVVIGVGYAVSVPMVQAIVPQLVRPADLDGAIALSSVTFNLARAIGPALAGWLVAAAGAGAAFGVNAASFVVMIAVLLAIRPRPAPERDPDADRSLRAGLRWVRGDRVAVPVLLATVAIGWASDPVNTLSPAVADQLGRGEGFVGGLVSAFGAGAAVSALAVDRIRRRVGHTGATRLGLALIGIGMVGLTAAGTPVLALAALGVAGVGFLVGITSLNTALQRRVPEELRARVMALWSVALLGVRPLAALVDGALADLTSVSTALVVAGVVPAVAVIALARADLDPTEPPAPSSPSGLR